ncbi:Clp protease N-terminal domain-containing protein [Saccharothrix xinjiangensis]|uniref:Clp protease N-terminal domain-containing protein n=1 Tax=Saccharothrix xinjiangensis TaxID=204798 RepID=A0ABV9XUK4_9PSEU
MFRGDHPELGRAVGRALSLARELGHPRTGSEHLLLALADLTGHGDALRAAVREAPVDGAGAAADRETLAVLGVDLGDLLDVVDRLPAREPLLPLGAREARERCARADPPLGLDAQAALAASLRLALARREREHRREHLALALVALDPGVAWLLATARVDRAALLADLATRFPPPRRNPLLRAERRLGHGARHRDLVRRYERTTGREVVSALAVPALILG